MKRVAVDIVKKAIQTLNILLTILIILFYFVNLTDLLKLIAEFFHYNKLFNLINAFYKAIDYEKLANVLGFDHGFLPFLSWHNFQIWIISFSAALIIIQPITFFVPNKGLKSEPVGTGGNPAFNPYNINISDRFPPSQSPDLEFKIAHLICGIPKNIAESILTASAEAVKQNNKLDILRTVIKYRIEAILLVHKNLEKTTGRILEYLDKLCKIILIGISILVFWGLLTSPQVVNNYIYCYLFAISLFITRIIKSFKSKGKYGLCKKFVPKKFLKKYFKKHHSMPKILEILLVGPHMDVYYVKEQAVIDLYSYPSKIFNWVMEDLKYEDILDSLKEANDPSRNGR